MRSSLIQAEKGAAMVEASIALLIFFGLLAFIFDHGILLYRHSQLVDIVSETLQEAVRDPAVRSQGDFEIAINGIFSSLCGRRLGSRGLEARVVGIGFIADSSSGSSSMCRSVSAAAEWQVTCFFCWQNNFSKLLRANSTTVLENPELLQLISGLEC